MRKELQTPSEGRQIGDVEGREIGLQYGLQGKEG